MKTTVTVCDRCKSQTEDAETISGERDFKNGFDLCYSCYKDFLVFTAGPQSI